MAKQVYNNFNTTEKYELFNSFNKSLLKDWMLELKSQGKSKKTINVYEGLGRNFKQIFKIQ